MVRDRYNFPCIIRFEDDVYYVEFPDIPEAFTDGYDMEEALFNARDVLGLVLYEREENNIEIPEASKNFIKTKDNESIAFVDVYMPLYRDMIEQKSVKKTLTIPKWLNDVGMENNLNFSQILQVGIKRILGLDKNI